jgi:4-hydroxybenzoate polyprenyltransferase
MINSRPNLSTTRLDCAKHKLDNSETRWSLTLIPKAGLALAMLRCLLELSRVSNLPTALTNTLAAWLIAGGALAPSISLGWLMLGAACFYAAGMILNDAADVAWDAEHRPERPIPSGRISRLTAWWVGLGALVIGVVAFGLAGASLAWTLGLVAAILVYDFWHKGYTSSIWVMGACRTLLYLAVASAVVPQIWYRQEIVLPAAALGLYIVGLTLTARSAGLSGIKKMLMGYLLLVPIIPLLSTFLFAHFGNGPAPSPGDFLVLPFMLFVSLVSNFMAKGGKYLGQGVGWLLAGIAAVDALAVAPISWQLALGFVAMVPLLKLWQRWIAAT